MRYQNAFLGWLPLVVVISGLCLLVYASVQQNYRQSLNDPQIQMAEDIASGIGEGQTPAKLGQEGRVDLRNSLAPWIAIYDAKYDVWIRTDFSKKNLQKFRREY